MQQTKTYKLNLIETSDTFSPDPLNENTEKLEAEVSAEAAARAAGDAALDQRVTVLEGHKIVSGIYIGDDANQRVFPLGFTPKIVLVQYGGNVPVMGVPERPTMVTLQENEIGRAHV